MVPPNTGLYDVPYSGLPRSSLFRTTPIFPIPDHQVNGPNGPVTLLAAFSHRPHSCISLHLYITLPDDLEQTQKIHIAQKVQDRTKERILPMNLYVSMSTWIFYELHKPFRSMLNVVSSNVKMCTLIWSMCTYCNENDDT